MVATSPHRFPLHMLDPILSSTAVNDSVCCVGAAHVPRDWSNPVSVPWAISPNNAQTIILSCHLLSFPCLILGQLRFQSGKQNIFARIVRKEEPADIVYEDDTVIAFKDSHPVAPCHLLIVPKMGAVRNPNHLTVQHVDLLEHMVSTGTYR